MRKFIKVFSILAVMSFSLGLIACKSNTNSSTQNSTVQASNDNSKKEETKTKQVEENKINGIELGVLSKEEFKKAIEKGKEYKGKEPQIEGKNSIINSQEKFKETYGQSFSILTPYYQVVQTTKNVVEKYLDPTEENICKQMKENQVDLNKLGCVAIVGGNDLNFAESLHMVLKVYNKDGEKVLQPKSIDKQNSKVSNSAFFPSNPKYINVLIGIFDAQEVKKINPTELEIIVIYPDGKEVKQRFNYSKLNDF